MLRCLLPYDQGFCRVVSVRFVRPAAWEAAVDGEACSKTLPEVSLLCSGRLMRGMGIRAQIVRDLQGDERDEDSQQ